MDEEVAVLANSMDDLAGVVRDLCPRRAPVDEVFGFRRGGLLVSVLPKSAERGLEDGEQADQVGCFEADFASDEGGPLNPRWESGWIDRDAFDKQRNGPRGGGPLGLNVADLLDDLLAPHAAVLSARAR